MGRGGSWQNEIRMNQRGKKRKERKPKKKTKTKRGTQRQGNEREAKTRGLEEGRGKRKEERGKSNRSCLEESRRGDE